MALIRRAEAEGVLRTGATPLLEHGLLGRTLESLCPHHRQGSQPGCSLESTLGTAALPHTCRQFPRVLLVDSRGWHQSLSAWCVTAADLIVHGGDNFLSFDHIEWDPRVHLDALDAREAWPPELRPGVLMGHDAYERYEARVLEALAACPGRSGAGAEVLQRAVQWTAQLRSWRHGDRSLDDSVHRLSMPPVLSAPPRPAFDLAKDLISRVPSPWRPDHWPNGLTDASYDGPQLTRQAADAVLRRYLGTRLVGSWIAYQGRGVLSVAASLVSSYALAALALSMNGDGPVTFGRMASSIRAADWLQLHLLDREVWADWCAQWETHATGGDALRGYVSAGTELLDGLTWAAAPAAQTL